jgi:pyruvate/2-oxoglutarate/acetoin dehydrogenase E1 component
MTFNQAFALAIAEEMSKDAGVFVIGQDIGRHWGGSIGEYKGLEERFGPERIRNSPISERAILGAAVGAAIVGMRPIAHLMFCEFLGVTMAEIMNALTKTRYMSGGRIKIPVTITAYIGAGLGGAAEHSSSVEGLLTSITGLKVVLPSTPYDVKGLLKSAIRDDNPVVYLHHKFLVFNGLTSEIPDEEYVIPLGRGDVKRVGNDVTVVATGAMVHEALAAADELQKEGISVEVVDPRTLEPLDTETIIKSIEKTGRLVVFTEEPKHASAGLRIAGTVAEAAFDLLDAPIRVIGAPDTPVPFSPALERVWLPNRRGLIEAVSKLT